MAKRESILVVDDEIGMCRFLKEALADEGYLVETSQQSPQALKRIQETAFDLIISDVRMPRVNGMDLLRAVRDARRETPVILMTAFGTVDAAVEAMKEGAVDYITKPFKTDEIRMTVSQVLEKSRLERENRELRAALGERYAFKNVIGTSPSMRRIFELMHRVKDLPSTVLITGESGTGKELIARALHFNGTRAGRPFVAIDCSALPAALLESELFGQGKPGLLESADGGTVFLDEIGDMAFDLQARLLRFLQEGEVRRVGSTSVTRIDARVIAATQQDLESAVKEGRFRQDLYFRLAVVPIRVPPLRERREDIPLLVEFILKNLGRKLGRSLVHCEAEAIADLASRSWPGNVRELQNALEFAASISLSPILKQEHFLPARATDPAGAQDLNRLPYREAKQSVVESFERDYLASLLRRSGGNVSQAARLADMDRKNLYDLLKKYGLRSGEDAEAKEPHP